MAGRRQIVRLQDDLEQILAMRASNMALDDIARRMDYSKKAVEEALLKDAEAREPEETIDAGTITRKMMLKANMMLDSLEPAAIAAALADGKIKDVTAAISVLVENASKATSTKRGNRTPKDIDSLVHALTSGVANLQLRNRRVEALGRAEEKTDDRDP